jgi:hypothetical protein
MLRIHTESDLGIRRKTLPADGELKIIKKEKRFDVILKGN